MIFAETPRLYLRALEKTDLPRLAERIGDWDVCKWLTTVPHPYTAEDAEEYYDKMLACYRSGVPEYFVIALKADNLLLGAVGLHSSSRVPDSKPGEIEIGYWLGKDAWGRGLMSEAVKPVLDFGFQRQDVALIAAATDPANEASQNTLRKAGLKYFGVFPRQELGLRGPAEVTRWELSRSDYEKAAGRK